MRASFLQLCFLFSTVQLLAQRPDSVQINSEWYFVYPVDEQVFPTRTMLRRSGLSEKQFTLFLQWKLAGDPRTGLRFKSLKDSLNAELVRTKRILTLDQDATNWKQGTQPPNYWGRYMEKKSLMRKFQVVNVNENDPAVYDLAPSLHSLPDGKYIQYFSPFLSYDRYPKMQVVSGKTAAIFALKDNLLHGEYTRLNYNGDTVKHGMFEEGLKNGTWYLLLSTYFEKAKSGDALKTSGTQLFVDLKGGVPDGKYHTIRDDFSETTGQYRNGFAYGKWDIKIGRKRSVYHHIVDGEKWSKDTSTVLAVVSEERIRRVKGFDFSEWENTYKSTGLDDEFVFKRTIRPQNGVVFHFGILTEDPLMGSSLDYQLSDYDRYNLTAKAVRFTGCKETYFDDQMQDRVTVDSLTHVLTYSRYYKNGHLLDTMLYNDSDSLFHYKLYDAKGKLYLESAYDQTHQRVSATYHTKTKPEPSIKWKTLPKIEGFPVFKGSGYYNLNHGDEYIWSNYNDSVIDGKLYYNIIWDKNTQRRHAESYRIGDTLFQLNYNKWGLKTLETQCLLKKDSIIGYRLADSPFRKYRLFWDDLCWEAISDSTEDIQVKLYKRNQLYSGHLIVQFSDKKVMKYYTGGANALTLTIPRYFYSKKMNEQFLNEDLLDQKSWQYEVPKKYRFTSNASVLNQMLMEFLTEHLMTTINQNGLSGNITDGVPSGGWNATTNSGEATKVNVENGTLNGSVKQYAQNFRYTRRYRKRHQDDPFFYQHNSDKKIRYYLATEYTLKNGNYDGHFTRKGINGDTLFSGFYNSGRSEGKFMQTNSGDTLTGFYQNGEPHGNFYYQQWSPESLDTSVFVQFKQGKLNGKVILKDLGPTLFGGPIQKIRNNESEKDLKFLRGNLADNQLSGSMGLYDTEEHLDYRLSFKNDQLDTLFFCEGGEVSYYFTQTNTTLFSREGRLIGDTSLHTTLEEIIRTGINDVVNNIQLDQPKNNRSYLTSPSFYWLAGLYEELEELKNGYFTKLYPNNQVARMGYRSNDKNSGLWKFYSYEGNLLYTIDYIVPLQKQLHDTLGIYTEYSPEGKILSKRYVIEELEKYDCSHADYYAIRQFIVFEDPKDSIDRSNGVQRNYFDNGMLMSEGSLKNGVPEGVWKFFTPDGRLTIVGKYINGKKEGRWLSGDLGDKKYIGEICLDPDDPFLDFHIAELENKKDIRVQIYKNGIAKISQFHEVND